MLLAMTGAIAASEWMDGLSIAGWVAFIGLLSGVALAYSHFPSFAAHVTSFIYSVFVIGIVAGRHESIAQNYGWQWRVTVLVQRINDWLYQALHNGASRDNLIFLVLVCIGTWWMAHIAAWNVYRHNRVWFVIVPAGAALFTNTYYYTGEKPMEPYLAVYLLSAILILVYTFLGERETLWRRLRIKLAPDLMTELRRTFMIASSLLALVAMLFAWQLPEAADSKNAQQFFSQMTQPYSELQSRFSRLFSSLRNYNARPIDSYNGELTLSGARELTNEVVMNVTARVDVRNYWRAEALDSYDGRTWRNTVTNVIDLDPRSSTPQISVTGYISRERNEIDVRLTRGSNTIYTSGQPLFADIPTQATYDRIDARNVDIQQLSLSAALVSGGRFKSVGSISNASVEKLRATSPNLLELPANIRNRYLQIPGNVPARVRDLAKTITQNASNNFDKATAIEQFMRREIAYDETISAPPAGVEASDYILFNTRRAYCTYDATAMIVMLRSLNIPARMAVGYAQGEPSLSAPTAPTADFTVRMRDSHAWVEVYFPRYGWVEFEPTGGQSAIARRSDVQPTPTPQPTATPLPSLTPTLAPNETRIAPTPTPTVVPPTLPPDPSETPLQWVLDLLQPLLMLLLRLAPFVLIALAVVFGLRYLERRGTGALTPIPRAYALLSRWATWLGIGATHTPHEQASKLAQRAPTAQQPLQRITDLYVEEQFGPDIAEGEQAAREKISQNAWQRASASLRLAWLKSKLFGK